MIGFSKDNDIRMVRYFTIPFSSFHLFKTGNRYAFSIVRCDAAMKEDSGIFGL
jgi:hypothetical protein